MMLMPVPRRAELVDLPISPKAEPHGLVALAVLTFLKIGSALKWRWARNVYLDYIQFIDGRIYYPPGRAPSASTRAHEAVHEWQQRTHGTIRFVLRYYLSRTYRAHCEAMAYAHEVVYYMRSVRNGGSALASPVYMTGLTPDQARQLIEQYVSLYLEDAGRF